MKSIEFGNYERSARAEFKNFKSSLTADVDKLAVTTASYYAETATTLGMLMNDGALKDVVVELNKGSVGGWNMSSDLGLYSTCTRTLPDYTDADRVKLLAYLHGEVDLSMEEYVYLDVNGDGFLTLDDYDGICDLINGERSSEQEFKYQINPMSPTAAIKLEVKWDEEITSHECSIGSISKAAMREIREDIILIKNHLGI